MGTVLALISAVFGASKDLVSKKLSFGVDGIVSAFASFLFALPFYLIILLVMLLSTGYSPRLTETFLWLVVLRSVTDAAAEWMKMSALRHGDISLLAPFFSLSPLFLLVLSPFLTGDVLTPLGVFAVSLIVAGTLLIVPNEESAGSKLQYRGILLSLGSSFLMALNICFDRLAVQQADALISGFAMTLLSGVLLLPLALKRGALYPKLRMNLGDYTLRGLFEVAFMVSKLWALNFLSAPYVAGLLRVSVLFSIMGGRMLYQEGDFKRRLLAGVTIIAGAALIILES